MALTVETASGGLCGISLRHQFGREESVRDSNRAKTAAIRIPATIPARLPTKSGVRAFGQETSLMKTQGRPYCTSYYW